MNKITNRAKQAEATKNKIYECGVKLIQKHGFDQVTVEQISKEAGVAVGTYYYYFESKFDLFSEIYKRADDYFKAHVKGHLSSEDCAGQIVEFFEKYAEFCYADGVELVKKLYTPDNKLFITKGRDMQNILQTIIEEGQTKKELPAAESAAVIADMLFVTARGVIYNWCLHNGEIDLKVEMKKVISIMVKGLIGNN